MSECSIQLDRKEVGMTMQNFSLPYYEQVLDFLAASPSTQEIVNFRPSQEAQSRFSELIEANRQRQLTLLESEEFDHYIRIDQMISLLKAKAYRKLDNSSE
jgi:hypothetical protein